MIAIVPGRPGTRRRHAEELIYLFSLDDGNP